MLEASLAELANLFHQHDEPDLAKWIDHTVQGDSATLPQRVLEMFKHGMGGLMDRALYSGGELDWAATEHRDALADRVYEEARARLRLSVAYSLP
jgi:hypothetical protein